MNYLRVTIASFLVVLVVTATVSNSLEEPKEFICTVNDDCVNYIACKSCSYAGCKCDHGTCGCHDHKHKPEAPTHSPPPY
ncbi:unnamed protein product [Cochlearia groenlandica]